SKTLTIPLRGSLGVQRTVLARPGCRTRQRQLLGTRGISSTRGKGDFNSGFVGTYDPTEESGQGPMFNKASFGVPQFYPRDLKRRVDDYVVGQDRAKKAICTTIFNHYQTVRRRRHHEHQERNRREKVMRQMLVKDRERHQRRREARSVQGQQKTCEGAFWPLQPADVLGKEEELPGPHEPAKQQHEANELAEDPFENSLYTPEDMSADEPVQIDKSNMLLIGPTGVGKTYILETLSKKINVPFSICDCNSFTQAGYIGQDVESCIERLLIESNYDIKATEHGIVVLDEFDKIARRETSTGRDVSGEGVQQALLKLIEGTRVTINVKDNRSSRSAPPITTNLNPSGSSSSPAGPPGGKVDQYTINTKNILFVFCGAFVGLDKAIARRVSKPSVGFGGALKGRQSTGSRDVLPEEVYSHLPHFSGAEASSFTPLDLVTPEDLQAFGFIPELIGRLHNICTLSPLSKDDLYRILTEPRNSLSAQYMALFETYPSHLQFTEKALYAIAERAESAGTGARGLKMEIERVLAEAMFEAPMPYVLITEACVKGTEKAAYWAKDGRFELDRRLEEEMINPRPTTQTSTTDTLERYREEGQSGG
ncbi:ATP-dependent Clp protease ATP-binding subunit ClpX, partial [Geosmithia morbida]